MKELLWIKSIKDVVFPNMEINSYKNMISLLLTYYDYGVTSRNT